MNAEQVRAGINLHAILRNMEDLSSLDEDAATLLQGHKLRIVFTVPGLDPLTMDVQDGALKASRGKQPGGLQLRFLSPAHFNGMVSGTTMPLPTGGLRYLPFLKNNFSALAKDLEKYLRPDKAALSDPVFREKNARLLAAAAMYALPEVAHGDPLGQQIARAMGEGTVLVEVPGQLDYAIAVKDGQLTTATYTNQPAQAFMRFDNLDTLGGVLRGELDSYLCIGRGQIEISGRIPMVDNLNKLLHLVSVYLA